MFLVDNVLVSDAIIEEKFSCNLDLCSGACCIEGDTGAPLDPLELADIEDNYIYYKKYLTPAGVEKIEKDGFFDYDLEGKFVTPLLDDLACAFICYCNGIAKCAIEKAFLNKESNFRKPVSCHLYPIRIKQLPDHLALNYHRWEICSPACSSTNNKKIVIYKFLKEPLIRMFGKKWYNKLCSIAEKKNTNQILCKFAKKFN